MRNQKTLTKLTRKNRIVSTSIAATTLVELMIAVSLLGIIAIGMVGSFASVGKAIQFSKTRGLASNLVQEQLQILKQKSFNKILVTTAAVTHADLSDVRYDTGYYPPETIMEGGIPFTRYTLVQVADEDSGTLDFYGAIPDTGIKAITVSVVWDQGDEKRRVQMKNLVSNIDTTMTNSVMNGRVTSSTAASYGIPGAFVTLAENVGFSDTSNGTGNYTINLSPGSYSAYASAPGYFPSFGGVSIGANTTVTRNFSLTPMAYGSVEGTVWINDHLVISQIVASSQNASGFCQEYVEIFNPSTWTWTIASGPSTPVIELAYARYGEFGPTMIDMDYVNTTVGPGRYFLFANTGTVVAAGVTKTADAVFSVSNPGFPNLIWSESGVCGSGGDADTIGLLWADNPDNDIDVVGWQTDPGPVHTPPGFETEAIGQTLGLEHNEQFVRKTSTAGHTVGLGPAYDSDNNDDDFVVYGPLQIPPRNSSDWARVVSGKPAAGAYVSSNDSLSETVQASLTGSPPVALFQLTQVATGTWNVFIASNNAYVEISSVIVTANTKTFVPNSVTYSSWAVSGYYSSILSSVATSGYISGRVVGGTGLPISPAISVAASGFSALANTSNGRYFLTVPEGIYDVTANANNANANYVSFTSQTVLVQLGQVTSGVDFALSQGGRIRGFVTRDGINALPNVSLIALDSNSTVRDQDISGSDGRFNLINLATGTYIVEPVLGSGEASTPTSLTANVTIGSLINIGTFTVTGSYGYIRGAVSLTSIPIRTGVLIVCSTMSLASGPPVLNVNTLSGGAVYTTNSYEDGTYVLEVRGSTTTTYNLAAYYTTFSGSTPIISTRTASSVQVTAGQSTNAVNFTW